MYIIKDSNEGTTTFKPGQIATIKNEGKVAAFINIYVANKDSVPATLAAGSTVAITTGSAGESYFYKSQETDTLTVTLGGE